MINHPNRKKIENTLFPGRPKYTGPPKGWFGLLHHRDLCEMSHDVNERVDYVKRHKPKNEVAIRLHNMIYLGDCAAIPKLFSLNNDYYNAKLFSLNIYNAKRAPLDAEILAYIILNIPDCAWNGETLVFP